MSLKNSLFRRFSFLILIAVLTSAVISACSDSTTESTAKLDGNLNDSNFTAASDLLADAAFELEATNWFSGVIDSIPGLAVAPRNFPGDASRNSRAMIESLIAYDLVIDDVNWWFIFTVTVAQGLDTANLIDSVRLLSGGVGVNPMVDSTYTQLESRIHAQISANTDGAFVGTIASHAALVMYEISVDSVIGDTLGVSYSGADTLTGTSWDSAATCDITVTTSKSATNVVFVEYPDGSESCPLGGSISASATMDLMCQLTGSQNSFDITNSWGITAAYNSDGSANVVFEDATTRWVTTVPCDQQPAAGPIGNVSFPGN